METRRTIQRIYGEDAMSQGKPPEQIIETTETAALCSVELGETAPEGKGKPYVKSVHVYGYTVEEAGRAAAQELARLRAGYGRGGPEMVTVSRATAIVLSSLIDPATPAAASVEDLTHALQELRTALSFGVRGAA